MFQLEFLILQMKIFLEIFEFGSSDQRPDSPKNWEKAFIIDFERSLRSHISVNKGLMSSMMISK